MSFYKRFNILKIEIYKFVGGIGVKGSFGGLYTFLEVAEIYGIDDSCLRKQVARGKFVIGEEVKKICTRHLLNVCIRIRMNFV